MKTLRSKFLVPILTAVFVIITITVAVMSGTASKALKRSVTAEMNSKVITLAETVENYFSYRVRDLKGWGELSFATDFIIDQENSERITTTNKQLKILASNYPVYQSVNIINASGDVIASSSDGKAKRDKILAGAPPLNLSERGYFQSAMRGEYPLSEVLINKATGLPVICIAAPFIMVTLFSE